LSLQPASTPPILGISFSANRSYILSILETDHGDGGGRVLEMGLWGETFLIRKEFKRVFRLTEVSGRSRLVPYPYMRQPTVGVLHDARLARTLRGIGARTITRGRRVGRAPQRWGKHRGWMFDEYLHNGRGGRDRTCAGCTALSSGNRGPVRRRTTQVLSRDGSHQNTHEIPGRHSRSRSADRGRTPSYLACSCRFHARGNCDTGGLRPGRPIVGGRSGSAQTPQLIARDERTFINPLTRQ
jgi:hypothetical protein